MPKKCIKRDEKPAQKRPPPHDDQNGVILSVATQTQQKEAVF